MGAAALVARGELRRLRGTVLLLVVMVALVSGAVFTSAAGARRTSTVLDRFVESTGIPEAMVGLARPRIASDSETVLALAEQLGDLDGVEEVVPIQGIPVVGQTQEDMVLLTAPDDRLRDARSPLLVDGRLPEPDAVDEVTLNESAARELGLAVGDQFVAPTTRVETAEALYDGELDDFVTDGPVLEFEIVGVFRDEASFQTGSDAPIGLLAPAAAGLLGEVAAFTAMFDLSGDVERIDLDEGLRLLSSAAPDGEVFGDLREVQLASVATAFDAVATGLFLFAAIAAVAGLIAVGQAVARQVSLSERATRAVRSLGMSRPAAAASVTIPVAIGAGIGVLLGVVLSTALSPLFPISTARLAEVDSGVRIDWPLQALGACLAMTAVVGWGLAVSWRQAKVQARSHRVGGVRWRRLRRALPPPAAIGFNSVASPESRRGVRAGSAVLGAVIGIAGVSGIALFAVSQENASGNPARYGWTWDASPDLFADDPLPVVEAMAEDTRLDGVGGLYCDFMEVGGSFEIGCALLVADGVIELTYLEGRAPAAPSEVSVATETMDRLGVGIGDEISVTGESGETLSLVVVGKVVSPVLGDDPARGLVFDLDAFDELADEFFNQNLILDYAPGADQAEMETALLGDYPLAYTVYAYPAPPQELGELGQIRSTLVALALFMGVLAALGLGHFLMLSGRRHRGDFALLKSLGFLRKQIFAVVSAQALTVVLVGLALGLPLGAIVGRWVWIETVDQMGIVDTPTMPWEGWLALVLVSLFGAVAMSVIPGRRAARRRPAEALRAE